MPAAPVPVTEPDGPVETPVTLESLERSHIIAVLERTGWVIQGPRGAAAILGIHPNTLRSRMERLGIGRRRHGIS